MAAPYEAKGHYQQESVAAAYDRVRFSGLGGSFVNRLEQRMLMKALAGLPRGARILDLPVGTGRMSRRFAAEGFRPIGADISEAMMGVARSVGDALPLVRADGEALPFARKSFDAAVCIRLLSHLPPEARRQLLRELARVASDRVVAVYQPHKTAAWWLLYGGLLRRPLPRYYVSDGALRDEFADCGLRVVRSHALLRGVFMERAYVLAPIDGSEPATR
jgi:ubiquinone/menaquinone biosynthesis C-methylase UbiE